MRGLSLSLVGMAVGGCATSSGGTSAAGATTPAGAGATWKVKYSTDYDTRNGNMVSSTLAPLDDEMLEGVWNDASDSTIALLHREGEELRLLVAVGDTRSDIPLTMFEVTDMGNHLPDDQARARAKQALTTWRTGPPTEKNRFLWTLAGKHVTPDTAQGSWSDGNAGCETGTYWGNFTLRLQKDKNRAPVLMLSVMASTKKFGGGIGGQTFDYSRIMYFEKSAKPIPPSLLET